MPVTPGGPIAANLPEGPVEQAMHLITHCHHRPEWTPAYEYHKAPSRLKLSLRGGSARTLLLSRAPMVELHYLLL